jgi:hypothetical protein
MVHEANADGVALAWRGDPGGRARPMFRLLDAPSWTQAAPVDLTPQAEAVIGLAAGAGVLNGNYAGDGYAAVWRDTGGTSSARPAVEILDRDGHPVSGPIMVAGPTPYPGRPSSITWTGQTYLTVTPFSGDCGSDPQCVPRSIVVGAVHPPSSNDAGRVTTEATFAAQGGGPTSARIASHAGGTWVAWFEGNPDDANGPRTLRVAAVGAHGERIGAPSMIADNAHPLSRAGILAAETGLTVAWIEDGNTALADDAPGRSRLVLVHGSTEDGFDLLPAVPITRFASYGIEPALAAIESTRSILVAYTARGITQRMSPMWLTRFDCAPH